ncbi:MAG: seg [Parcubacteria group bacterium]|nr:seg [Parcubacteria group bacterium]
MIMIRTHNNSTKGFTIIETLVAVAILIVAVTGAFSAAQTGLSSAIFSKNEVIAFYLAQEGVENIRNIRDENGLKGQAWLTDIANVPADPCYFGKACITDSITNTISPCSGGASTCPVVLEDPVNGFYGYNSSWAATPFTRSIVLTQINANEVSILVTVTWSKGIVARNFHVRENILNWQ